MSIYVGKVKDFDKRGGWFFGHFIEEIPELRNSDLEVAWKDLEKGFSEPLHVHRKAIEVNIVVSGWVKISDGKKVMTVCAREFYIVHPNVPLAAVDTGEGTTVIVIKTPSVAGDKFVIEKP